ncbi:MAG: HAMP domain-containing sensor histidine kinase [Erythrobacter sp.]|uniref:sensor histidine kinase n=1 Tax=Erythrobacter sp. TaxID=1042 RepID=UPI00261E5CF6|nr:HAMP domain-containing sensor histidine kinase [Erythrobacter sp.]MDJ0977799.1 HAMP domain-containing sensor histidine kinase [Erythrobacter sp.]
MERQTSLLAARGVTDDRDRLLTADDPLADLHQRCGGTLPGTLAVPELLELVQQGRRMGLKIAREFSAYDGEEMVSGFVRVHPLDEERGGGCEVLIENWQRRAVREPNSRDLAERLDAIDQACAEITARLDPEQRIQLFQSTAVDAQALEKAVSEAPGSVWTDHIALDGIAHRQPLHWRLLDGARCRVPGSSRGWRVRLLPLGAGNGASRGFDLLLIADHPLSRRASAVDDEDRGPTHSQLIGRTLTPVLREPIARIIANAETIRARLAGPLRAEYSEYAGNIAAAGQHLNGLLDDLADLEVVEAEDFSTASEEVDLGDAARRAAGILGGQASAKNIELTLPIREDTPRARGEFRRVLQILINLIGNAIAYSPEGSAITITSEGLDERGFVTLTVRDQGPGVDRDQAERMFNKFERLGRENDGGTGLGLYISSRLARAMGGALTVANPGEAGAAFQLALPHYDTD